MTAPATDATLHAHRSRCIDSFARAELAVDKLLRKLNLQTGNDLVSVKLERLRKAKTGAGISTERKAAIDELLNELATLLPIRNDLVHAPMAIRRDAETAVASFANPRLFCNYSTTERHIDAPHLQSLAARVAHIAAKLETGCQPAPKPTAD